MNNEEYGELYPDESKEDKPLTTNILKAGYEPESNEPKSEPEPKPKSKPKPKAKSKLHNLNKRKLRKELNELEELLFENLSGRKKRWDTIRKLINTMKYDVDEAIKNG